MPSICFYFEVHQPFRLNHFSVFNIGNTKDIHSTYFNKNLNQKIFEKVASKCYLPTNNLLLDLIRKYDGRFRISYSLTGTFVEYCENYKPELLDSFKELFYDIVNEADEYYDAGLRYDSPNPIKLISARVSLIDAADYGDIGLEVNGLDTEPDSWAYLAMAPSDGSVYAYVGHLSSDSAEETYTLLQGTGMPASHELAIGWDGSQITFYMDGQPRKSLPTQQMGQWARVLFDIGPQPNIAGSFDDVRITYAGQ